MSICCRCRRVCVWGRSTWVGIYVVWGRSTWIYLSGPLLPPEGEASRTRTLVHRLYTGAVARGSFAPRTSVLTSSVVLKHVVLTTLSLYLSHSRQHQACQQLQPKSSTSIQLCGTKVRAAMPQADGNDPFSFPNTETARSHIWDVDFRSN